ncbi:MAG: hypothetical protein IJK58_03390 [Clostridia bacterium]|nr:hypothetical protein [Clostridia bacterium]
MTEKELRRLSRKDLLEIMVEQAREIEELKLQNSKLADQLKEKRPEYSDIGSLADASVQISGVLKDAQAAADVYLTEIENLRSEAKEEYDRIIADAKEKSAAMIAETETVLSEINDKISRYKREIPYLTDEGPDPDPGSDQQKPEEATLEPEKDT